MRPAGRDAGPASPSTPRGGLRPAGGGGGGGVGGAGAGRDGEPVAHGHPQPQRDPHAAGAVWTGRGGHCEACQVHAAPRRLQPVRGRDGLRVAARRHLGGGRHRAAR